MKCLSMEYPNDAPDIPVRGPQPTCGNATISKSRRELWPSMPSSEAALKWSITAGSRFTPKTG
jgi:hypothetical protein